MANWRNENGSPLSSFAWLEAHNQAKLHERTKFVHRLAARSPKTVVDLGCGPGIWLHLLDDYMPSDCEFIGLDADSNAVKYALERSRAWQREVQFQQLDIVSDAENIPAADMYLAFNIFPYLKTPDALIEKLRRKLNPGGCIVIRQYDGSLLRIGPMAQTVRTEIDLALQAAVLSSEQFKHYDLDRIFNAAKLSSFNNITIEFESFSRTAPYPPEFIPYLKNTIEWTRNLVSDRAKTHLDEWWQRHIEAASSMPSYFTAVDMVAWLS